MAGSCSDAIQRVCRWHYLTEWTMIQQVNLYIQFDSASEKEFWFTKSCSVISCSIHVTLHFHSAPSWAIFVFLVKITQIFLKIAACLSRIERRSWKTGAYVLLGRTQYNKHKYLKHKDAKKYSISSFFALQKISMCKDITHTFCKVTMISNYQFSVASWCYFLTFLLELGGNLLHSPYKI